jgi:hypothetical protein
MLLLGGKGEWRGGKNVVKILAIVVSASRVHDEVPLFKVSRPAPNKSIKLIFAVTLFYPLNSLLSIHTNPYILLSPPKN